MSRSPKSLFIEAKKTSNKTLIETVILSCKNDNVLKRDALFELAKIWLQNKDMCFFSPAVDIATTLLDISKKLGNTNKEIEYLLLSNPYSQCEDDESYAGAHDTYIDSLGLLTKGDESD
jgi:hypothetical protein